MTTRKMTTRKKKWEVIAIYTTSKYVGIVEATTEEDAKELGDDLAEGHLTVCHQCSRSTGGNDITLDGIAVSETEDE